jgi:hypothetical protein
VLPLTKPFGKLWAGGADPPTNPLGRLCVDGGALTHPLDGLCIIGAGLVAAGFDQTPGLSTAFNIFCRFCAIAGAAAEVETRHKAAMRVNFINISF